MYGNGGLLRSDWKMLSRLKTLELLHAFVAWPLGGTRTNWKIPCEYFKVSFKMHAKDAWKPFKKKNYVLRVSLL